VIRKLLQLDAPLWAIEQMFLDYESWPEWMSGFRSVRILDRTDERVRIEAVQEHLGQRLVQVLDCRPGAGSLHQRQVSGRFRSWQAHWRFFVPPAGVGTVVEVRIDMDLGVLGLLVPSGRIYRALDQSFEETAKLAAERARRLARSRMEAVEAGSRVVTGADDPLQQLLEGSLDPERVVIELGGLRYRLVPVD
jgi:ribosome-associated toxin RatA of RatAB toxin-antitoxin module